MNFPHCILDVESTGLSVTEDRVISFAAVVDGERFSTLVNPGRPIPNAVTELTGIDDAMVANAQPFREIAQQVQDAMFGRFVVGFGLLRFDLPLLVAEFDRCGMPWILTPDRVIDVGNIYKKHEERTLAAAMQFYCNEDHAGAHDALADVLATGRVLAAQIARYGLTAMPPEQLATESHFDPVVDFSGKLSLTYLTIIRSGS